MGTIKKYEKYKEHEKGSDRRMSLTDALNESGLPDSIEETLRRANCRADCPTTGAGVHAWIFDVAIRTKRFSEEEVISFLEEKTKNCGRMVPPREIMEAMRIARGELSAAQIFKGAGRRTPRWPEKDDKLIELVSSGIGLSQLHDLSSPIPENPREIISQLFKPGELVCVGLAVYSPFTEPIERVLAADSLEQVSYIVPSPMKSLEGRTTDCRLSPRTNDNTGKRRFLVLESDLKGLSRDDQSNIILHINEQLGGDRLCMVVHSGGDSLHAWFACRGLKESEVVSLMKYGIRCGADPRTFTPSQFVRFPGGTRENGAKQKVEYFNPQSIKKYV